MGGWLDVGAMDGWVEERRHKKEGERSKPLPFSYNFIAYSKAMAIGCPSRSRDTNRLLALNRFLRFSRDNARFIVRDILKSFQKT